MPSRPIGLLFIEKLPLFALAAVGCILTIWAQGGGGAVRTPIEVPFGLRLANAAVSYIRYVWMHVWPIDLGLFYPHPALAPPGSGAGGGWAWWQWGGSALVLVAVTAAAACAARRPGQRYLLVGWLWLLGTLVPVIGLVHVGAQALADRYTYIPSIGLLTAATWGAAELASRWRVPKAAPAAVATLFVLACAALSVRQISFWRDTETVYARSLAVNEDHWSMHEMLALHLENAKRHGEAMRHYRAAATIRPDIGRLRHHLAVAHNNFGVQLAEDGRLKEAIEQFESALRLRPDYDDARRNLARARGMAPVR